MRGSVLIIGALCLFGLAPIAAWIAMAASLDPGGMGRSIGMAILVVLSPGAVAGMLMILGAILLRRTRRAGRILATIGAAIMIAGVGFLSVMWLARASRCVEAGSFCVDRLIEGGAGLAYVLIHGVLIALLWRRDDRVEAHSPARGT